MTLPPDSERVLVELAEKAGAQIMKFYGSGTLRVAAKADASPLSEADEAAHVLISEGLLAYAPGIPIISEEGDLASPARIGAGRVWMVDPLDGTKEFINHKTDFTVNIALVEDGVPILGVVHAPALDLTYYGRAGQGARRRAGAARSAISTRQELTGPVRVVASKSHMTPETEAYLRGLPPHELVQAGSSLKLCRVAEGTADLYPRFGRTMEWDTAAGHAVLAAAGGAMSDLMGVPLRYNKADLANPHFLAAGSPRLLERFLP